MQGRGIAEQLLNPPPYSALARARDFGIDLTLIAGRLKLTPEARLDDLQRFMDDLEAAHAPTACANSTRHLSADGND
ncbi:MAG: hypothetical protein QOJ64_1880 [Acidobacteriota bacterium]|jgi:hypothetical protein|nr:hypothetical protein [Acidobacteriota bacterium]